MRYSVLRTNSVRPSLRPDLGEQNDRRVEIAGEDTGFERLGALEIVPTGADTQRETHPQHWLIEKCCRNHARWTISQTLPHRRGDSTRDVDRYFHQRL